MPPKKSQKGGLGSYKQYVLELDPKEGRGAKYYRDIVYIIDEQLLRYINLYLKFGSDTEVNDEEEKGDTAYLSELICGALDRLSQYIGELYKFPTLYREFCQLRKIIEGFEIEYFDSYLKYFERCDQIKDTKKLCEKFCWSIQKKGSSLDFSTTTRYVA